MGDPRRFCIVCLKLVAFSRGKRGACKSVIFSLKAGMHLKSSEREELELTDFVA